MAGEGRDVAFGIAAERGDNGAMALGQRGERMVAVLQPLQRRQRGAEPGDQFGGDVELIVGDQPARIAAVKLVAIGAEGGERVRKPVAAGARPRAAQQRAFQRGNGGVVRALC